MGKKRNSQPIMPHPMKMEIKDEMTDNELTVARDRLKGALQELLHHSESESSGESSEETSQEYHKQNRKSDASFRKTNFAAQKIKRRTMQPDPAFQHTYVMKLFDRSVDLAQFQEDTPLYPICRAWMANQPRNPMIIPKVRSPSPDSLSETNLEMNMYDSNGQLREFNHLPLPLPREETEPTNPPVIEKGLCGFMVLDLEYEGQTLMTREELLKDHRARWVDVRKKVHQQAHKNEERFIGSANILNNIFRNAQGDME